MIYMDGAGVVLSCPYNGQWEKKGSTWTRIYEKKYILNLELYVLMLVEFDLDFLEGAR